MASITTNESGTFFDGPEAIAVHRAISIADGLRLYARCGLKPTRGWSPTKALKAAEEITGKRFKRGQYTEAAFALSEWAQAARAAL